MLSGMQWVRGAERMRILLAGCLSRCPLKTPVSAKKPAWNSSCSGSVPPAASGHATASSPRLQRLLGKESRALVLQVLGDKKTSTLALWCCSTCFQRLSWVVLELRHTLGRMEICFLKWQVTGNEFFPPQLLLWSTQLGCHQQYWNHPQIFHHGC